MDADITVHVGQKEANTYSYSIILNHSQDIIRDRTLATDETKYLLDLNKQCKQLFENRNQYGISPDNQYQAGYKLFKIWFQDTWKEIQATITASDTVCITIASEDSEILNLPWELMNDADPHFFSTEPRYSIRRYPGNPLEISPSPADLRPGPLRILFMACSPRDEAQLYYEREEEFLQYAIQGLNVAYDSGDMGTFQELEKRIGEFRPHVVHLSGHGTVGSDGKGYFVFEDDTGDSDLKSSDEIRRIITGSGVQCIFVSGCLTGLAPSAEAINGICQNLVHDGIPFALGWAASIADIHATDFAREFYQTLAAGGTVDRSVNLARWKLWDRIKSGTDPSWILPVLYTASHQKTLYDPKKPEEKAERNIRPVQPLPGMNEGYARHFAGRRREQQQLLPGLRSGELSVVILTGLGGAGKSALATKLTRKLEDLDHYIPLVVPSSREIPLSSDMIIEIIGVALGCPEILLRPDLKPSLKFRYILSILNEKKYVLLLDNFESNLDEYNRIVDNGVLEFYQLLLSGLAGGSRVIITTRYLPQIGKPLPRTARECQLGDLSQANIVKVMRTDERFEELYRNQNLSIDFDLLHRVFGGVPRFIEQILSLIIEDPARFQQDLKKITLPACEDQTELRRIRDEYYTTLVLDRLYEGLDDKSQIALSRCAVYNIAITPDGMAAVSGVDKKKIEGYIDGWKNRAFIFPERESGKKDLWVLYGMLRPWLSGKLSPDALKGAARAAGDFLISLRKDNREGDIGLSWVSCLLEARSLYLQADHIKQARAATKRVWGYFERQGMYDLVRSLSYELLEREDHPEPMVWIGVVDANQGKYKSAREQCFKALDIQKARGDKLGITNSLHNLATIDLRQGDYDSARERFTEAMKIRQEIGDRSGIANTLHQLASIDLDQGDYDSAREQFTEAMKINQELGDRRGIALTLHQLASIDLEQGDYDSARERFTESMKILQEIGDRRGIAATLHSLASIDLRQGDYDSAREKFTHSLLLYEQLGSPGDMADELSSLASVAWETDKKTDAIGLSGLAYVLYQSKKHTRTDSALSKLQNLASEWGFDQEQVSEIIKSALEMFQANGAASLIDSIWPSSSYKKN